MVTLRQLEVFAEVVNSGSVTAAAHRLFVSQPSVSDTLRAIEIEIEAPLFIGRGRARELSPAGQVYFEHTRLILATVDQAAQAVADLREKMGGRLRILAVTTAGEHLLPRMLRGYLEKFPDVEVTLQVSNRAEARRALVESAVDIAVMGRPPGTSGRGPTLCTQPPSHGLLVRSSPGGEWNRRRQNSGNAFGARGRFGK